MGLNEGRPNESLGEIFIRKRNELGKSQEEASASTKIHLRQLKAMEADDYESLPAEVFVRGFIRLYADYLGLSKEKVLAQYFVQLNRSPDDTLQRPYRQKILTGEPLSLKPGSRLPARRVCIAIVFLSLALLLYLLGAYFMNQSRKSTGPLPFSPTEIFEYISQPVGPGPAGKHESSITAAPNPSKKPALVGTPKHPAAPTVPVVESTVLSPAPRLDQDTRPGPAGEAAARKSGEFAQDNNPEPSPHPASNRPAEPVIQPADTPPSPKYTVPEPPQFPRKVIVINSPEDPQDELQPPRNPRGSDLPDQR